jgi:hypothetical protein
LFKNSQKSDAAEEIIKDPIYFLEQISFHGKETKKNFFSAFESRVARWFVF